MWMWGIWLILAVILFIFEAMTTALVTVWFAIGALAALIVSLFTDNQLVQIFIFVVVSLISLIFTRPLFKKYSKIHLTNIYELVGKEGIATTDIINDNGGGQAKLSGQIWTAKSNDDSIIKKNSRVIVKEVKGVSVIVKKIN